MYTLKISVRVTCKANVKAMNSVSRYLNNIKKRFGVNISDRSTLLDGDDAIQYTFDYEGSGNLDSMEDVVSDLSNLGSTQDVVVEYFASNETIEELKALAEGLESQGASHYQYGMDHDADSYLGCPEAYFYSANDYSYKANGCRLFIQEINQI